MRTATKPGHFVADYFCVCGLCQVERGIGASRRPDKEARKQGYRYRKDIGWICPDCVEREATKRANQRLERKLRE